MTAYHDHPDARSPDTALEPQIEPEHWRAPGSLCGLTLHLSTGHALVVPPSGIVEVHPDHGEVKADLRGRGFRQMRPLDRFGKAGDGSDPAQMFRRDQLRPFLPGFVKGKRANV